MSLPYTAATRAAMDRARHEARALAHEFLGTEHALLGLMHEPGPELTFVLSRLQVAAGAIRHELDDRLTSATAEYLPRELPMTPRLAHALHYAEQEALAFEQGALGAEHLLLGLLREEEGAAAAALAALGVTLAAARAAVGLGCGREYSGGSLLTESAPVSPPPSVAKAPRAADWRAVRVAELERRLWEQQVFLGAALGAAAGVAARVSYDCLGWPPMAWALIGLLLGAAISALGWFAVGAGVWGQVGLALGAGLSSNPVLTTGGGVLGLLVGMFIGVNLTRWRWRRLGGGGQRG